MQAAEERKRSINNLQQKDNEVKRLQSVIIDTKKDKDDEIAVISMQVFFSYNSYKCNENCMENVLQLFFYR